MLLDYGTVDMTTPLTINARIYVGNLPNKPETDELFELFSKYGTILGIKNCRHYSFIQFATDASATAAIADSGKIIVQGKLININCPNQKKGYKDLTNSGNNSSSQEQLDEEEYGEDSMGGSGEGMPVRASWMDDGTEERWPEVGRRDGRDFRGGYRHPNPRASFRDRSPINGDSWQDNSYDRFPPVNDSYRTPAPERNDCEIIVVSKILTEYAEYIEDRLKRIGLVVDLLFPNEDVPIGRVLGNISSRGCLYAILVMPQNQEHRSLTLNILHGLPQEHRNMPLEDAINLVSRNYREYQYTGSGAGRDAVLALLRQLSDGSTLTVLQYDTILTYVKDCREKQVKMELGDTAVDNTSVKTQVNLQERIMNILNSDAKPAEPASSKPNLPPSGAEPSFSQHLSRRDQKAESENDLRKRIASVLNNATSTTIPQPVPAPSTKTAPPILSNPSVQKALDSLLGNII